MFEVTICDLKRTNFSSAKWRHFVTSSLPQPPRRINTEWNEQENVLLVRAGFIRVEDQRVLGLKKFARRQDRDSPDTLQ